jgi:hypothetical protein
MPREAPPVLLALADLYRKSASSGLRDYTFGYEELLRIANCHDGDDRERAEDDLKRAELTSGGLLMLDRAPRSGILLRVRLAKDGGEAWLFESVGQHSPSRRRDGLVGFFTEMAEQTVPSTWLEDWQAWCLVLKENAASNRSIQPFKRDDPEGNRDFLNILLGVIQWQGESLIRYASSMICKDSKKLEALEPRLLLALQSIRGGTGITLEDLGILTKPRALTFHGPLVLKLRSAIVDFAPLPGPTRISEVNLIQADEIVTAAPLCLTVENEEVFLELAKRNPGWLLVHTSFPGSAVRRLFRRLRPDLACWHFGDSDPAGFDILRDLREKTGRDFQPVCMEYRPVTSAPPLTADERKTIHRLLAAQPLEDVHPILKSILEADSKGNFEQECVPLERVLEALSPAI